MNVNHCFKIIEVCVNTFHCSVNNIVYNIHLINFQVLKILIYLLKLLERLGNRNE